MKYEFGKENVINEEEEFLNKEDIMNLVVYQSFSSKKDKIKKIKKQDETLYIIKNSKKNLELSFPDEYKKYNRKHLNLLNKRCQKQNIVRISSTIGLITLLGTSIILSEEISLVKKQIKTYFVIERLEREIDIHSGHDEANPYLGHDCVIGGPENGTIQERITSYCEEKELGQEVSDKAIEKFEMALHNNAEYEEIDLHKVYKK